MDKREEVRECFDRESRNAIRTLSFPLCVCISWRMAYKNIIQSRSYNVIDKICCET